LLAAGEPAPDFDVEDANGNRVRLSELAGKKVVLFFFPKAFTPGCRAEVASFVQHTDAFAALNTMIVGVSVDDVERQCGFSKALGATFAMVPDPKAELASSYGVRRALLPWFKRVTFIINEAGVVEVVFRKELQFAAHATEALAHIKGLDQTPGAPP
jgi:peroxiredoxin Q/BCP